MEIQDVPDSERPLQPNRTSTRRKNMGFWSRTLFQRIFLQSLCRLIIYLNKIYQDFGAVNTYHSEHALYFEIISLLCLILPSMIFAIYQSFAEFIKNENFNAKAIITKFVNGLLLIPWQMKRYLDGLYFSSQNLCSFRQAKDDEKENFFFVNRNAETLEFFEDFYAGFIQVVMQIYILSVETNNKYSFIIGEVIGSALSIFSMLIAIRRRDDGILTVGWTSMFASRILVFALAAIIIKQWIVVLCLVHVIGFTIWVYKIAMEALEEMDTQADRSKKRGFSTAVLIFFFFGLPSLVMWPYMFYLKEKQRPMRFLFIVFIENTILVSLWFGLHSTKANTDIYWLMAVIVTTVVATLFLSLYFCCKPSKVDQVVLYDMRYSDTESFGIYFEFCDIVFNLKVEKEVKELLDIIREKPELTHPRYRQQQQQQQVAQPTAPEIDRQSP
ncbi:xk-related domain containing protein [Dermatophagoides farinae]|uniref:XK-related protein n=1 Tax=Dermatophagoides farinae TaxID=6954 RepID=A0A9D4P0L2_DERFA|nr:xk-related domain containing protein [Dermatophagoides farinae]